MKIFISGSLAYDRIMDYKGLFGDHILPEKIHDINVSFYVDSLEESYGGTAGNIAYTLSLLGDEAVIVANAGNDFEPYMKWMTSHHIGTGRIRINGSLRTAFATVMTDQKYNQISAFYPGAMQLPYALSEHTIDKDSFVIVAPGNPEDMRAIPEFCRTHNIPFMFDPGQQISNISDDDIKKGMEGAKVCIVNDYERALITKKTGWSAEDMLTHTEILVTTFGREGSEIRKGNMIIKVPAGTPKNSIDPTGAGDAYRAGFMHGLLKGWTLETIGKFAGLVACYTVELRGTQTHIFNPISLGARYKENFKESLPS
ncbi:MAG: carbohydrate kinase family protein [Candidatus Pacebacteria bacterium]|nr:carbohydrate kinase family protein [Candidatus Paceibacterota bacterium]